MIFNFFFAFVEGAKDSIICSAKMRKNVTEVFQTALRVFFECGKGVPGQKSGVAKGGDGEEKDAGGGCCVIL
jgi:hypothetical protein